MLRKNSSKRSRSKNSYYPVNISHQTKYIELQKWLKVNGVTGHHLRPAVFHNTGRGLMATKAIKRGDIILSVPVKLLITTHVVLNSDLKDAIRCFPERLTPKLLLCAFLIKEKNKGSSSSWSPYIDCLPEDFDNPSYFKKGELDLLPVDLMEKAREQWNTVNGGFKSLKRFFHHAKKMEVDCDFSLRTFMWAWFVVNTRTLYMKQTYEHSDYVDSTEEDVYVLAPFLDLLNHSPNVQVTGAFNTLKQCYEIHSSTPFSKYDQVFIQYGPHDNEKLLLEYGFIVPSNPHNVVNILLDDLMSLAKLTDLTEEDFTERFDLIRRNNLWDLNCSASGISWHLRLCFNILCMGRDLYKRGYWRNIISGHFEASIECQISSREMAVSIMERYLGESSKRCQEMIAIPDKSYHTRMVLQLFQEKEAILKECLSSMQSQC